MHADLALMLLVLVFGCAAFLFGIVYVVYWVLSAVWGGLVTVVTPASEKSSGKAGAAPPNGQVCPNRDCRHAEWREASYCCRCGERLRRPRAEAKARRTG